MSLTIRRATTRDAAAYARIMGHPQVFGGLMQMPFATEQSWFERLNEALAPGRTDLLIVAERDGEVLGTAGLHPAGPAIRRRHALMLGISVAPEAQRQGVGSALMAAMCDYADRWIGALRIELTVYTDNAPAIALYRKFGFELEGTHRGYALRDGRYVDAHAMARFHPNPPTPPGSAPQASVPVTPPEGAPRRGTA
jgi:L-phenylalanine/L-methionine N-acetyltransferase